MIMVDSRRKGITAEQHAANWLAANVHVGAHRIVRTGWATASKSAQDPGDISLPGLCVQVKNLARPLVGKLLTDTWAATLAQAASTDKVPLLLEKRAGTANVGHWWLHLASPFYVELVTYRPSLVISDHLVRVELNSVINDLRYWCWKCTH